VSTVRCPTGPGRRLCSQQRPPTTRGTPCRSFGHGEASFSSRTGICPVVPTTTLSADASLFICPGGTGRHDHGPTRATREGAPSHDPTSPKPVPSHVWLPADSGLGQPNECSSSAGFDKLPRRARRRARRTAVQPRGRQPKAFLEIFGGSGRLTGAVRERNLGWYFPVDVLHGDFFDLSRPDIPSCFVRLIRSGVIGVCHFAPPCASWSTASAGAPSAGNRIGGLACAKAMVSLLRECRLAGVLISVENPHGSSIWSWPPLVRELQKFDNLETIVTDYCTFGTPYRKRTRFISNIPGLAQVLASQCGCTCPHIALSGTCSIMNPSTGNSNTR